MKILEDLHEVQDVKNGAQCRLIARTGTLRCDQEKSIEREHAEPRMRQLWLIVHQNPLVAPKINSREVQHNKGGGDEGTGTL